MAGRETQRRAVPVWIVLFDRFVARWLFAFIALSALGLVLLTVMTQGWVHLVLSLPVHLGVAVVAGGIALLTRSPTRRRSAVICLLGDLAAGVPNLVGVSGPQWRGLLTGVLLVPVFVSATRRALTAEPVDVIVGGVQPTPEVAAARSEVAAQVPPAQVHGFHRPVLVLNPRSGSAQAVREQLLEAAGRYGVQVREAAPPTELVAIAHEAVADGADVLGVAGGDGSLAAVATVAIEAELPFVCVPAGTRNHFARDLGLDRADPAAAIEAFVAGPERRVDVATVGERLFLNNASIGVYAALVHEPSYRDDRVAAIDGVLESVLERSALPVQVSFRDGSGNAWDQVLVLLVSNNAYPLTSFGGRSRLDAGMLEVSALRRTEGQEIGRALENLVNGRYQAGEAGRAGPPPASRSTRPAASWRSASTASRSWSTPRSNSGSMRARSACWSPGPDLHPRGRPSPSPRRGVAERWPLPQPRKDASSSWPSSCGWAACSAGSVSASSGPAETSTAGQWPHGSSAGPIGLGLRPVGGLEPDDLGRAPSWFLAGGPPADPGVGRCGPTVSRVPPRSQRVSWSPAWPRLVVAAQRRRWRQGPRVDD
jgi:diacylglycerol kinase family enzyme